MEKCKKCGKEISEKAMFCKHCGEVLNTSNSAKHLDKEEIEKLEKKIRNAGSSAEFIGYFSIVINGILLLAELTGAAQYLLSTIIYIFFTSIATIVLGKRIKSIDTKTIGNLNALIVLTLITYSSIISFGGSVGIVGVIFFFYYLSASGAMNKLLHDQKYTAKLEKPSYKFNLLQWLIFIIIGVIAVAAGYTIDKSKGYSTKIDQHIQELQSVEWKEFNSVIGQFKVLFPTEPTHESSEEKVEGSDRAFKLDTYSSVWAGMSYFVQVAVYPDEVDTSKPEENLEGSVNGIVSSDSSFKLISSSFTNVEGFKAVDFVIQSNESVVKGRNILVDHTLYTLMSANEGTEFKESDYNNFISSFDLVAR